MASKKFSDLVNIYKKPTSEAMRKLLLMRGDFSDVENDFITYMAGFSHREFSESLFQEFNLSFLANSDNIFYDLGNDKFHAKVLINDQTTNLESLDLWSIAKKNQVPAIENQLLIKDENGFFIDDLRDKLRKMSKEEAQLYWNGLEFGLHEYVVRISTKIGNHTCILHFVEASQNNPINLGRVLDKVSICVFASSPDKLPNSSLFNLQQKVEFHPFLKNIVWYVLDINQSEDVISFLQKVQAIHQVVPYSDDQYDYFNELLPRISNIFLDQIQRSLIF
jgi:hypothetical protein